ncbi:MAG TPA: hypothetical protein VLF91_06155 [Candidatus Saccharimonadales bacterium]|nr:hypothetical protein [Candidatus Saccharimonadales bacterium]
MRFHSQKTQAVRRRSLLALLAFGLFVATWLSSLYISGSQATAAANNTINFQARLMTAAGAMAADGNYNVEFKLYNATSSTNTPDQGACTMFNGTSHIADPACLWVETRTGGNTVHVANGYLTVSLGSVNAFPSTINWSQQLYLTMNIGGTGGSPTWDGEMSPRLQLTAVPYAFAASTLAVSSGSNSSSLVFATPTSSGEVITLPNPASGTTATVCYQGDSTGCGFALGSTGSFIQNTTTTGSVQTGANFNIRSAGTTSVTGTLQGANGQTVDLFDVQTYNGTSSTNVFQVASNGDLTTQNISVSAGKNITFASGAGSFDQSAATTGTFKTGGGNVSLNGATTVASNKSFTAQGDVLLQDATNGPTAFRLQNSIGSNVIQADTTGLNTLINNGNLEGTDNSNWSNKAGTGTPTRDCTLSSGGYIGACAEKVVFSTGNTDSVKYTTPSSLSAGTYSLSFSLRETAGDAINGSSNLAIGYNNGSDHDAACIVFPSFTNQPLTNSMTGWARYTCTFTTTGTTTFLYWKQIDTPGVARNIYIDALQLEAASNSSAYHENALQLNGVVVSPLTLQNASNSTTAFQVQNAAGTTNVLTADTLNNKVSVVGNFVVQQANNSSSFVSVDTANSNFYVGSTPDCSGRFCVATNLTGLGGSTYINSYNIVDGAPTTNNSTFLGQNIVLSDTGTATGNTLKGLVINLNTVGSGFNTTNDNVNGIIISLPAASPAPAGNAILVQGGAAGNTNLFQVSNGGGVTIQTATTNATALVVKDASANHVNVLQTSTNGDYVQIGNLPGATGNASAVSQGILRITDITPTTGKYVQLQTSASTGLSANQILTLPDETGTLCTNLTTGTCAGTWILNQTSQQASANFNISGSGTVGGGFSSTGGTVNLNASSNNNTNINTGTSTGTVAIGNSAAGAISLQSSSTIAVTTTNFNVSTAGVVTVAGNQASDILPAAVGTSNGTANSLTLTAGAETSNTCTTACVGGLLKLQGGNASGSSGTRNGGSVSIDAGTGASTNGDINLGSANAVNINVGSTTLASGTQTVNVGANNTSGATVNVTVGSGSSATGGTTTVQAKAAVTITAGAASTWSTSAGQLTLQGGGGLVLNTPNSSSASTNAVSIKSGDASSGSNLSAGAVTVDTGTHTGTGTGQLNLGNNNATAIQIGNGGSTTTITGAHTSAGGAIQLNVSSNFNTSINTGTSTGAVSIGNGSSGTLTVQGNASSTIVANNGGGNTTTLNFTAPSGANTITFPAASGTVQLAPASGSYIQQVPATTATNTIAPTAAGVIALSIKGTTNATSAHVLDIYNSALAPTLQDFFDVNGSLNVAQLIQPTTNNAIDLGTSSNNFRTGYFGTSVVTPLVSNSSTLTLQGSGVTVNTPNSTSATTSAISIKSGDASVGSNLSAGSVTVDTGTHTGSGTGQVNVGNANATAIQIGNSGATTTVTGALTSAGGAIQLNASSNFNTSINTGSSTGTVGIGNSAAGAVTITSGAASTWSTAAGLLTIQGGGGLTLNTPNSASASTNAVSIKSGDASTGSNLSAGTVTVDTGTKTGTGTAQLNLGNSNATAIQIGNSNTTTTVTGALTSAGGAIQLNVSSNNNTSINTGTSTGAISIGNSASGTLTVQGGSSSTIVINNGGGNTTTLNFTAPSGANTITFPAASGTVQLTPTTGSFIQQVPGSTGTNTIAPTAASVVALTIKGTTGTAAHVLDIYNSNASPTLQDFFDASGSLNVSQIIQPTANNTIDLGLSGTAFRTGYFGTSVVTPLVSSASTLTLQGTSGVTVNTPNSTSASTSAISIKSGDASVGSNLSAGTVTIDTGTKTGTGTAQLNLGNSNATAIQIGNANTTTTITGAHTSAGGAIQLNVSSNFNTSINTGTSTGTISIGNSASGTLAIQGGSASTIVVNNGGGNTTTLNFTAPSGANTITFPAASGTVQLAPTSGSFIYQTPPSTAANTINPGANNFVALTVRGGSSSTPDILDIMDSSNAKQAYFDSVGRLNVSQIIQPTANNTIDLGLSGTAFRTGYFATSVVTPLVSTAATLTLQGTTGTNVNTPGSTSATTAAVNIKSGDATVGSNLSAGTVTVDTGSHTGTGTGTLNLGNSNATAIQIGNSNTTTTVTGALTSAGGAIQLNVSSNNNTSINTGSSTGTVGIGNSAAGAVTITSGAASTWSTSAGVLTIQGGGGLTLNTPNSTTATTNNISIKSGDASVGSNLSAGTITLDTGTHTGTGTGTLNLGNTNATAITVGNTSATAVTIQGGTTANTAVTISATGAGGITMDTGNNGSILIGGGTSGNPTKTISIGPTTTNSSATTYNFGVNTSGTQTINIGSATSGSAANGTAVLVQGGNSGTAVQLQALASGTIGIGTANAANTIQIGATALTSGTQAITIGNNGNSGGTQTVIIGSGNGAAGGTTTVQAKGQVIFATAGTTRGTFDSATNSFYFGNGLTAATPNNFTISGTASLTTAVAGGSLTIQGGNATVGNANGGSITLTGGTGFGTGVLGLVSLAPTTFVSSGSTQTFNGGSGCPSCSVTGVDTYSTIAINAATTGLSISIPVPNASNQVIGRILYITGVSGSSDFTIVTGGTSISIGMKANSTATLIWNGTGWTAAGASSSTDLQSAYNNTLTSAGGAELIVSNGSNANGLTIRDSTTSPINGTLLEVQSSTAAQLFSVSDNVTDYASDGGAETAGGGGATSFPSSTWAGIGTGASASRFTTTGSNVATGAASVQVITGTTANTGVADTLVSAGSPAALTANQFYNVSFAVRLASGGTFTDLEVDYSKDGTNTSSVSCTSGVAVKTSVWTKVNCTFQASASGITTSNAILIRQATGVSHTFYVDDLSVTLAGNHNYATDGGVDDNTNFGTNWTSAGLGTVNVTRNISDGNDASDSASANVTAGATNAGLRNKLSINPLTSTLYRVSVYAKLSSGTAFTDFKVRYSRDGGTNFVDCVDYNGQAVVTGSWTQITCYITTDSTAPSNPYVYFVEATSNTRVYLVDTFSMTLSGNTTPDVQIGGGVNGGPVTLFTLDRAASAPIAANNDAFLGSMYYDTTLGKLQCYESDGWGACGSSPDNIVTLSPEYTNAVLHGPSGGTVGVGTMTSDICSDTLNINDATNPPVICGTNETHNFYKWTSPQPTAQTYAIYVTYQLPDTFKSFASGSTSLLGRTDSSNATVQYKIYRNNSASGLTQCGSAISVSTGSVSSWQTGLATGAADPSTCGFVAGDSIVFEIDMTASSNANAYVSDLGFTFSNQ